MALIPSGNDVSARPPELPFHGDMGAAVREAGATKRPLVVVFVAAWCPYCARMRKEVFTDPAVLHHADGFVWARVDIDRDLSTARDWAVDAVPLTLVLDADGKTRARWSGYVPAAEFAAALAGFREADSAEPSDAAANPVIGARSEITFTPSGYRGEGICFSHVGYGPLALYSQSPFQALRLGIRPRTPSTLGRGQWEVRASSTWVNVWAVDRQVSAPDREYLLDYETLQTAVSAAHGITDTVEIDVELQGMSRFGGTMDGFVQGFHDLFGIDQGGRDEVPRGDFSIELAPDDGESPVSLGTSDRGTFSRSLQVSIQHNVTCGTTRLPAFSYAATVRRETVDIDRFDGGAGLDLGLSVAVARRFGRYYLYGTFGYAWFGSEDFRGLVLEDTQLTALAAVEWRFGVRQSLLLQALVTQGVVADFGPFSDASTELTFGYKWELRHKGVLEAGLIENVLAFDNGPDFGVHVGYSQRF